MDAILRSVKRQIATDTALSSQSRRDNFLASVNSLADHALDAPCASVRWYKLDDDQLRAQIDPTLRFQFRCGEFDNNIAASIMSQSNACNFCQKNILDCNDSWGYHHYSYVSLRRSARDYCPFCSLLLEDVQNMVDRLTDLTSSHSSLANWFGNHREEDGEDEKASLYRWGIRSLFRMRDSKAVLALTFRIIPQQKSRANNDYSPGTSPWPAHEAFSLPERVFYCYPEQDLGPLLHKSDIGVSTNPEANGGEQIKSWIRACEGKHRYCPKRAKPRSTWVPTRLLQVGNTGSTEPIKVIETKPYDIKGPYVTLSHCWGAVDPSRRDTLLRSNIEQYMTVGIPWSDLSKNFQQAIEVARFLDVGYIWIDSLCIIQQDKDCEHEVTLMHQVYRNSYCNIAAVDAKDGNGGLFRKRESHEVLPARIQGTGTSAMFGKKTWRVVRGDLWERKLLQEGPLYKRGWVFQERMLSPRILHFTKTQLFWDCTETSACEMLPNGLPLPVDAAAAADMHWRGRLQETGANRTITASGNNDLSLDDFWEEAIEKYTSCLLTYQTDKVNAIWGIASLMRDLFSEEFAAGLWGHALHEQLAWRVSDCRTAERPTELEVNPSWAWTSVTGKVLLQNRLTQNRWYQVKNHIGDPLSFEVEYTGFQDNEMNGLGSCQEQLEALDLKLQHIEEKRKRTPVTRRSLPNATIKEPLSGIIPYERVLAIQGFIHEATMVWDLVTAKWALDLAHIPEIHKEDAALEMFPDVRRGMEDTTITFVILALSHFDGHSSEPSLLEPCASSYFNGVGILMNPVEGKQRHYHRIGAIQIHHLSIKALEALQARFRTNGCWKQESDEELGYCFFLE